MTSQPPLLYEKQDGIVCITINRPEARNALSPEVVCRLADAFVDYAADDTLRAAIITGAGDKAFCAGGDLGSMLPLLTGAREPADDWDRRVLHEPLGHGGVRFARLRSRQAGDRGDQRIVLRCRRRADPGDGRSRRSDARELRLSRSQARPHSVCRVDREARAPSRRTRWPWK